MITTLTRLAREIASRAKRGEPADLAQLEELALSARISIPLPVEVSKDSTSSLVSSSNADVVFTNVAKHYLQDGRLIHALNDCSLRIPSGELFSLLGPSGTGKTTLLGLVAGFEHPDTGTVKVGGNDVLEPGRDRAVVFQSPTLFPWLSGLDNVAEALRSTGLTREERRERAMAQLAEVGLADAATRRPHKMSGGMQQRVGIARALVMEPKVLIMDEPFAALDSYVRQEMQRLIVDIWLRHRITTLFVTHSIEEALLVSSKIGVMSGGKVTEIIDVEFEHPRDPTALAFNDMRREVGHHIEAGVRAERA